MIDGVIALYIFMLAAFTGYEVIARVPVILHTPLMSARTSCTASCSWAPWSRSDPLTRPSGASSLHRRLPRRRQRGRRLRRDRTHAADVQGERREEEMNGFFSPEVAKGIVDASYC